MFRKKTKNDLFRNIKPKRMGFQNNVSGRPKTGDRKQEKKEIFFLMGKCFFLTYFPIGAMSQIMEPKDQGKSYLPNDRHGA